jgi:hypothetical protein
MPAVDGKISKTRYETKLFTWAAAQGLTMNELARLTGYSRWHLAKIKNNRYPVTETFVSRVVLRLGEWSRSLFLPLVPAAAGRKQPEAGCKEGIWKDGKGE